MACRILLTGCSRLFQKISEICVNLWHLRSTCSSLNSYRERSTFVLLFTLHRMNLVLEAGCVRRTGRCVAQNWWNSAVWARTSLAPTLPLVSARSFRTKKGLYRPCRADCQSAHTISAPERANRGRGQASPLRIRRGNVGPARPGEPDGSPYNSLQSSSHCF